MSNKTVQDYSDEMERADALRAKYNPEPKPKRNKKKKPRAPRALTTRDAQFIAEYVRNGGNGSKAAIDIGLKVNHPNIAAAQLLKKASIQAELKKIQQGLLEKSRFSAEKTLAMLSAVIHFDPRTMFGPDGNLRPIHELKDDEAFALAGCDVAIRNVKAGDGVQDQVYKIKWADRLRAVELAMKHFGLISPAIEVNVNLGITERLNAARGRMIEAEVVKS